MDDSLVALRVIVLFILVTPLFWWLTISNVILTR
jgi:hypothetical protein